MAAVISLDNVSKRYRRHVVLDHLTLEVDEGSVFGLIGQNGAGKTTTIKILMKILNADGGEARVLGIPSRNLQPAHFQKIGYVSENQQMPGWMTVQNLIDYLKPFYPSWDADHTDALIERFKLPRDRKIRHLSRGMWMKTALLSSLAYRPRLLILDEPFSGLDPVVREDLIEGLIDSAKRDESCYFIARSGRYRELREPYRLSVRGPSSICGGDDHSRCPFPSDRSSGGFAGHVVRLQGLARKLAASGIESGIYSLRRKPVRTGKNRT